MFEYIYRRYSVLTFLSVLILPICLYMIPLDWFIKQHSICLFKNLLGLSCLGCGITKSVLCCFHFEFERAWYYNKLIIIVMPLLVFTWYTILKSYFLKFLNISIIC